MIDRTAERARLRRAIDEAPQLVVMRGRRRVGKSYLLNHSFEGRRFIYFQADEGEERGHLDLFAATVGEFAGAPLALPDWDAALKYVRTLAADEPLVLALDEYQWLQKAQPRLDSKIMRHFDQWQREGGALTLILSGSAISMMEELLEGSRPMFGRAVYRPLVEPFDFRDAAHFGPERASDEAKLRRFGILGGTAQYQVWAGSGSIPSVIRDRILTEGESLYEEPLQLIRGEDGIREPGSYYEILRAVARGSTQASEVRERSSASSSQLLHKRLRRLEQLRYIEQRRPIGGNGTTLWEVADPFFAFWFRYVYPNRSRLTMGRVEDVYAAIDGDLDNYMGWVFERICREWAGRFSTHVAFSEATEVGAYWTRTHDLEVDVVARKGRRFVALGSCKWSRQADAHVLDDLIDAKERIRGAGEAELFIFARGFHRSLVERAASEGVSLISPEDLFA